MTRWIPMLLILAVSATDVARQPTHAREEEPSRVVSVEAIPSVRVAPGDTVEVAIPVVIDEGIHVQANPAANEFLIPFEVDLPRKRGVRVLDVVYPAATVHRLQGSTEDLLTYHGTLHPVIRLFLSPAAPEGRVVLEGEIHYQACGMSRCLAPASVPIRVELVVVYRR